MQTLEQNSRRLFPLRLNGTLEVRGLAWDRRTSQGIGQNIWDSNRGLIYSPHIGPVQCPPCKSCKRQRQQNLYQVLDLYPSPKSPWKTERIHRLHVSKNFNRTHVNLWSCGILGLDEMKSNNIQPVLFSRQVSSA